jgi:hypothetical protein
MRCRAVAESAKRYSTTTPQSRDLLRSASVAICAITGVELHAARDRRDAEWATTSTTVLLIWRIPNLLTMAGFTINGAPAAESESPWFPSSPGAPGLLSVPDHGTFTRCALQQFKIEEIASFALCGTAEAKAA